MRGIKNVTLREVCAGIEDPRADRINKFDLVELLFAAMITVLCGATSYAGLLAETGGTIVTAPAELSDLLGTQTPRNLFLFNAFKAAMKDLASKPSAMQF